MATPGFAPILRSRISLAEIDAVVSARLGPTRIPGNTQPACFNRQIAMYLARHVGRWSTTVIGRFYNGRDHSTVCHGIQRIQALRESDPDVDALISDLKRELDGVDEWETAPSSKGSFSPRKYLSDEDLDRLAELIASRVCAHFAKSSP